MDNYIKINNDDVMPKMPNWIITRGLSLIFAILCIIVFLSWFIEYPDIIDVPVSVNIPETTAVRYEEPDSGKLTWLYGDSDTVTENQNLAYINNFSSSELKKLKLSCLETIEGYEKLVDVNPAANEKINNDFFPAQAEKLRLILDNIESRHFIKAPSSGILKKVSFKEHTKYLIIPMNGATATGRISLNTTGKPVIEPGTVISVKIMNNNQETTVYGTLDTILAQDNNEQSIKIKIGGEFKLNGKNISGTASIMLNKRKLSDRIFGSLFGFFLKGREGNKK